MVATTKPAAKALPSNFTRPPTLPVPETLLQTVPKPPPPPVPIGPALPEGQAPPYAVQQVKEPSAVPPRWALCKFKQVHRDQAHRLPLVIVDLPKPPPPAVGAASSSLPSFLSRQPQPTQRASSSTTLPENLTPTQAASRQDLTTIAIHPWPSGYEDDSLYSDVANIRSQYMKGTECDKILVAFFTMMSSILRHDMSRGKDNWLNCVDKSRWPHGIVWPLQDLCLYLVTIIHFTMHFQSGEFRDMFLRCLPDVQKHLWSNPRHGDWDSVWIPPLFVFKWLAICAFDRPRIAKLCATKYETFYKEGSTETFGRHVVDEVIGVTAIQGHTVGESVSNYQVLGWQKVNQAFTGIHLFLGFH